MNRVLFNKSYTFLVEALYDISLDVKDSSTYEQMTESISLIGDLTTILKRMGETVVLEEIQEEGGENSADSETNE